jgi:ribonuclease HI
MGYSGPGYSRRLENQGGQITLQRVPGHQGILGNEKADQAAKAAAAKTPRAPDSRLSLVYVCRVYTKASQAQRQQWVVQALENRLSRAQQYY